ncbi:Lipoprotein-releasing system transmembrane protein LolE [Candidatus Profftia lariciata]|uniref:lipoprotein-releasing ABC transporter permease subunit LolE n=1 Tax=Candidatus Profftia lariciata TaxID=1987921 RepID=UPI001D031C66|nr:lipoprotein-releasing ABC transporter permease subunit LolE [Candidatus Profftia lariciata]UDG81720.1 Lipoprotein-releasing system transmembrane protein LolE [Candidatus Profftia lariciata]
MFFPPLSLFIGLRFSRGRNRGSIVSFVSLMSIISIALSVAVFIVGLSAINGFERELKQRIISLVPNGEIYSIKQPFNNWQKILNFVKKKQGIVAVSPYIEFTGLLENGKQIVAAQLRGINPEQEYFVTSLSQYVRNDIWRKFKAGEQQVILGRGIAMSLHVKEGDWITVIISKNTTQMNLLKTQKILLHVSGIVQLTCMLDHSLVIIPLADAQKYNNLGNSITGISIKVHNAFQANKLIRNISQDLKDYIYGRSWQDSYIYMFHDIQMIRVIIYIVMILVICVACFNIMSILIMAVKNNNSNIAMLKTMGAQNKLIIAIFIWYGLLTGLIGSLCGISIGVIVSLKLTNIYKIIEKIIGYRLLSNNIYPIDFLPTELQYIDVVIVFTTAIILSLIASWYPVKRAINIEPTRILNGSR